MSLRTIIDRDLKHIERALRGPDDEPQWLVFGELTIPCVPSATGEALLIDHQGNPVDVDLSVLIRFDHFDLPGMEPVAGEDADALFASDQRIPKSGDIVRFRWKPYKVLSVRMDPSGTFIRLNLADPNSNR